MIQCEDRVRSKRGKKPRAVAEGNDQKADTENDTATFLEHGAGAPCRTITDREEHPLMPHVCIFLLPRGHQTDHQLSLNPPAIVGLSALSQHQRRLLHHL
jgi:hypothetical protein